MIERPFVILCPTTDTNPLGDTSAFLPPPRAVSLLLLRVTVQHVPGTLLHPCTPSTCGKPLKVGPRTADKGRIMVGERVALPKVMISRESREGWEQFCLNFGVTRTGLMEAIGVVLVDVVEGRLPVTRATLAVIERAKRIDLDRRRRLS